MKNRLLPAFLASLVASLVFAVACSGGGGRRHGGNTIKLDGSTSGAKDMKGSSNNNENPDLAKGGGGNKTDLSSSGSGLTCQEFFACMGNCADNDSACVDDCYNQTSPDGQQQFSDLFNCLANTCVGSGDCQVNSTGDGLVTSTTCSTCLNADATWNSCATEVNACM